jgi:hAT family C-terminal dimerisation region
MTSSSSPKDYDAYRTRELSAPSTVDLAPTTSTIPNSSLSNQGSRKRKTTANTWTHAREPRSSEPARCARRNEKIYYCKYCVDPTYSTTVSTTFRYHLLSIHGIELEASEHPIKKQRNSLIKDAFAKAGVVNIVKESAKEEVTLRAAVNRKAALEALVQLITVRNLSYNCSSWPELHALISAINPTATDLISLSHGSIQQLVSNSYCVHKDILRKKLQSSVSKLHLSADVWSAPNHKAFLGICIKFVDADTKETLQALLALSELPGIEGPGSHGGAEQWKLLRLVLEDYDIWQKIGFYTGDNHGSNDILCRFLDEELQKKSINWDARQHRIRCHGHVINLAVQAFLFMDTKEAVEAALEQIEEDDEVAFGSDFIEGFKAHKALGWRRLGPLGKVHNTAIHMRENDYRWNIFRKHAGRALALDNDTRWNSWYTLLHIALTLQDHVEWYQKRYFENLREDYLTPQDWQILGETRSFLQPFWKITQLTEGRHTTLDQTLFTMDVLHKHYNQAFNRYKDNHPLRSCIAASWAIFDKYYQLTDESPAYGAAMILHPSRRSAHVKKNWPKTWHKGVFDGVRRYWEDRYQALPIAMTTPQLGGDSLPPDEYDLLARELDVVGPALNEIDEYKSFINETPVAIDCSPLAWWLREEQSQRYPRLSKMAIDILSIPAMSAEPERVFSGARRTISWDRCQLGSRTIERGECMKSWIKSGITQGVPIELVEEVQDYASNTDSWEEGNSP